jgi:hypothetical protein
MWFHRGNNSELGKLMQWKLGASTSTQYESNSVVDFFQPMIYDKGLIVLSLPQDE